MHAWFRDIGQGGDGYVSVDAGHLTTNGSLDGTETQARFGGPFGLYSEGQKVWVTETWNHTIRLFDSTKKGAIDAVVTVAGIAGREGDPEPSVSASKAKFREPLGITGDGAGNIFIADTANNAIRQLKPNKTVATLFWSRLVAPRPPATGPAPPNPTQAKGSESRINFPKGVASAANGDVYFTERNCIRKIDIKGLVSVVAGVCGKSGNNGQAKVKVADAKFHSPDELTFTPQGQLIVADSANHCIRKIDFVTDEVSVVGGVCGSRGTHTAKLFNSPGHIALHPTTGDVFVSSGSTNAIIRLKKQGTSYNFEVLLATPRGFKVEGSPMMDAPAGIIVEKGEKALLFVDKNNRCIRRYNFATKALTVFAGICKGAIGPAPGPLLAAQFRLPHSLVQAANGDLFVSDRGAHLIWKLSQGQATVSTGNYDIVKDHPGMNYYSDGTLKQGLLSMPLGLALDKAGNLLIAEAGGSRIRKIIFR